MKWAELFEFMVQRDPEFGPGLVGVSRDDVETCQRELGITLPSVYVDFLVTMGADSGRYRPFGGNMDANFYSILRQIPPEDYDIHEYFLIAWDMYDPSRVHPSDLYLDLRRSDGHDCALFVTDHEDWHADAPNQSRLTLLQEMTWYAWRDFEAKRRKANRIVYIHPPGARVSVPPSDLEPLRGKALEVLDRRGFSHMLPAQDRVDCLDSPSLSASVVVLDGCLRVVLSGDDDFAIGKLVELLLDNVPGARFDKKYGSLP